MRVAWLGPAGEGGGVPGIGRLLLRGALDLGVEVDLFDAHAPGELPAAVRDHPLLRHVRETSRWRYERWYSRDPLLKFATGTAARVLLHRRLGRRLVHEHAARGYDCVFQLSQTELFGLADEPSLPPIVVHPCSHAAGELRWHRRESRYALRAEGLARHLLVRAGLEARARVQRREVHLPDMLIGPSDAYLAELCADYGLDRGVTRVLRHPTDLELFTAAGRRGPPDGAPLRLLFASRIAVRKGVELIVALSHRLADLAGRVRLEVVGEGDTWSDYSGHLRSLHPGVAGYRGPVEPADMPALLRETDVLLVPSHYEPGPIIVGEALACGVPVVVSDRVGAREVLGPECCRVFPDGDLDAFEAAVRRLDADLRAGGRDISARAVAEAREHFDTSAVAGRLVALLAEAAAAP